MTIKRLFSTLTLILWALLPLTAQIPAGYYDSANGLTGMPLKTALYNIIKGHTSISYNSLYNSYPTTDSKPNNIVWDMYSDIPGGTPAYTYTHSASDQCGNYGGEGDCYNREHSIPASWFNDATPMYSDLFIVYPTDGYVNNMRSNYPFGEVSSPSWTSTNGSKRGSCSYPGYTGTVFEPIDAYKGDFARTMFYIATRYENIIAGWYSNTAEAANALAPNNTICFVTWYLNMIYSWHISDPVSTKETDRNNAVYAIQDNRNPYIDHPEWVAVVWGLTTSSAEINPSEKIQIFPNPAREVLNISGPSEYTFDHVTITDVTGRSVIAYPMSSSDKTIDVSGLCKGMYFLVLENNGTKITSNFIKE